MQKPISVTLLGTRGTMPVSGSSASRYGGGTACVLIRMGGEVIVLDAGSGIMELGDMLQPAECNIHLLLSHPHFDHMLGLPSCPVLFDPSCQICIHAASHSGLSPRAQIERLMSPPLWPVGLEAFLASVSFHEIHDAFHLGAVSVQIMEGSHPGGCSVFRLEYAGTSIVYATDYELDDCSMSLLAAFAQDCSLLLCDGQYTEHEFETRRGFGHSSWRAAARLALACNAQRLCVFHHAPERTDAELDALQPLLRQIFSNAVFARYREEFVL